MIMRLEKGVLLQGESAPTLPAAIDVVAANEVLLTITQGKFHQVKRMFAAVGNRVKALHREAIGEINLDVEVGQWRYISVNDNQH
jgi:16S rRNA pseudouridine516 synthase